MKKEIIINASKDRSRIAIVENGELVELYVENPDNVRTIGNIYLGGVQKVMPAIRAAFVNVGQKQDAFLHFSDLTDNAAQLFALAGEDVPGLEAPVLARAPQKRVADDDSEPDVEDTLEIAPGDSEDTPEKPRSRSRSRRRSRGRGRGRGRGGRSGGEEEEEQEEGKKGLPSVIDLSTPPKRREPRPPRTPSRDEPPAEPTDGADTSSKAGAPETADEPGTEADARPKRTRRRSRSKADEAPADAAETPKEVEAPSEASADTPDKAPAQKKRPARKPRRSNTIDLSGGGASTSRSTRAADTSDDEDSDESAEADGTESRSRRGRKADKPAAPEAEGANDDDDRPSRRSRRGRRSDPASSDTGSSRDEPDSSGPDAGSDAGPDAGPDGSERDGDASTGRPSRSRRSRGRGRDSDEASDDAGRSRRSRRSRDEDSRDEDSRGEGSRDQDSGSQDSRDEGSDGDSETDDGRSQTSGRGRSDRNGSGRSGSDRGGRSQGGRGRGSSRSSGSANANVPSAEKLLKRGTRVICKITKEPISTKGPRVSTDISLAGRFLVLVPAADYIAVSKKIESAKERRRLRTLAQSLKPDGFGVIVRTVADGRDAKSLDTDLRLLLDKWRKIERKLDENPPPPVLLYEDVNMVSSIIRDLFSEDYDRIVVDDPRVHRNVQAYVKAVAPQMLDKVELHRTNQPVYRAFGIERQVEEAFSRRVNMKGGGYLFIETTEAMHVVDVNSGRAGRGKSQKENLIAVNVEAAKEVAKQLRLRDLGGIIVVDFIDLRYDRDRKKVTDALKEAFKRDRAVTKILPMSDFGLVQITRQRLRPSITTQTDEGADGADAVVAAGAAEIRQPDREYASEPEPAPAPEPTPDRPALAPEQATPEALAGSVRDWIDRYRKAVDDKYKSRPIVIRVHPLLGAYLRRGFPTPLTRWKLTLRGVSFRLEDDASVDPLAFDVRDEKSGRSLLKKYS